MVPEATCSEPLLPCLLKGETSHTRVTSRVTSVWIRRCGVIGLNGRYSAVGGRESLVFDPWTFGPFGRLEPSP